LIATVWTFYTLNQAAKAEKEKIESIEFHDLVKAALDSKTTTSRTLIQTALLVGAALWGLVIAKKGEVQIVLGDKPEMLMFLLATCLLLGSLLTGYLYLEKVTAACADAIPAKEDQTQVPNQAGGHSNPKYRISDLFGPRFDYLFRLQAGYLFVGVVVSGVTFFSAHQLKGPGPQQKESSP
jgi:hypothetical protein